MGNRAGPLLPGPCMGRAVPSSLGITVLKTDVYMCVIKTSKKRPRRQRETVCSTGDWQHADKVMSCSLVCMLVRL